VRVLIESDRIALAPQVLEIYEQRRHDAEGVATARIESALPVSDDELKSLSAALEHWVEHGVAPGAIVAAKYHVDEDPASGIVRTRPLCPYPTESAWSGHGSRDEASNYRCSSKPASNRRDEQRSR